VAIWIEQNKLECVELECVEAKCRELEFVVGNALNSPTLSISNSTIELEHILHNIVMRYGLSSGLPSPFLIHKVIHQAESLVNGLQTIFFPVVKQPSTTIRTSSKVISVPL